MSGGVGVLVENDYGRRMDIPWWDDGQIKPDRGEWSLTFL